MTEWFGTNTEVDELQRTRDALEESEERLRLALAAVSGMGTFDWNVVADRLLFDRQSCHLFGLDPDITAAGIPIAVFFDLLHPEDKPRVLRAVTHTLDTGEEYASDYRVILPDQSERWISARGSCIFDGERTAVRFLGVCLDISQRKLTEQALIQNEKLAAVGRLAASIAHEINNPLESVTNLLYLARASAATAEVKEYLDTAEQELRRVSAIGAQTLRFHRQSTKPTLISCEELIDSVLSIYQGRLRNYSVVVEKRKRASTPSCASRERSGRS